jgi:hypothetical protein
MCGEDTDRSVWQPALLRSIMNIIPPFVSMFDVTENEF